MKKKTRFKLPAVLAIIMAGVMLMSCLSTKTGGFTVPETEDDKDTVEKVLELKSSAIPRKTDTESARRYVADIHVVNIIPEEPVASETTAPETTAAPAPPPEKTAAPPPPTRALVRTYYVNGHPVDRAISDYLLAVLNGAGIGWWMPYGLATMYQESRMNIYAVSPDSLDYGILQYRAEFWQSTCAENGQPVTDIYDWRNQINVYVTQTARRLGPFGCSIEDTISRHKQSDYGPYDAAYVQLVLQWVPTVYFTEE